MTEKVTHSPFGIKISFLPNGRCACRARVHRLVTDNLVSFCYQMVDLHVDQCHMRSVVMSLEASLLAAAVQGWCVAILAVGSQADGFSTAS